MKHAIILAHPKSKSFCASIARTCAATLRALGHKVIVRDLYKMDFDPRLQSGEIPVHTGFAPAPDVVAERKRLADVDSLIFVYPFWFNAPPAVLKGYVDRVFGMGFGYRPGSGGTEGLLGGKTLMTISTSGAPEEWVESTGALQALMTGFDRHLAAVTGLEVSGHVHLGSVLSTLTREAAKEMLVRVDDSLRKTFAGQRAG
ncbi:MAG: NAD(P)H-dependent oxidoreductase [Caulobacterales bacterium]|nr:NAD(P)H-dependent oxidoreductase [Caulobacterales bacterium]